jgi:hypothetical protein
MEMELDHYHMGIKNRPIPVSIRGLLHHNGYPFLYGDSSVTNPFLKRVCDHMGSRVKIPIKKILPHRNPRNHMGITIREHQNFPHGDCLFLKRVCDHMGSNMYISDTLRFTPEVLHLSTTHPLDMSAHSTMLSLKMTSQWYHIWKQEQSHQIDQIYYNPLQNWPVSKLLI